MYAHRSSLSVPNGLWFLPILNVDPKLVPELGGGGRAPTVLSVAGFRHIKMYQIRDTEMKCEKTEVHRPRSQNEAGHSQYRRGNEARIHGTAAKMHPKLKPQCAT